MIEDKAVRYPDRVASVNAPITTLHAQRRNMLRRTVLLLLVLGMALSTARIVRLERVKGGLKRDHIELSHIKYGLFNVDEWKQVIAGIVAKKIREIHVTKENRPAVKRQVEDVLGRVLTEVEGVLREENRRRGFMGWVRGSAMDLFDVMGDVRKGIPGYADMLIDYIEDPRNRKALEENLIRRFNEMMDQTVGEMDYTTFNAVLARYDAPDKATALAAIDARMAEVRAAELRYLIGLGLCGVALAALILARKHHDALELGIITAGAFILLAGGLSLPMIDIEATITSFSFKLVGEPVTFTDQVLFFQSKSILQVVWLLLTNGGTGLLVVAALVFSFSVLFPVAKLVASVVTIARGTPPRNALHRFLVFRSGKWSMADVMVVAIFMAFIGFNGVINSQLTQLAAFSGNVELFTTNNSVLQTGFYLFTAYCLTGLLLSAAIEGELGRRALMDRAS